MPPSLYSMIADDELMLWVGDRTSDKSVKASLATLDADLKKITESGLPYTVPDSMTDPDGFNSGVRLTSGRVASPVADQLMVATKQGFSTDEECATVTYRFDGFIDPDVPPKPVSVPTAIHDACARATGMSRPPS